MTHAIKLSQEHKFKHHGSCFKRNNKKHRCKGLKVCRYDLPNLERKIFERFPDLSRYWVWFRAIGGSRKADERRS